MFCVFFSLEENVQFSYKNMGSSNLRLALCAQIDRAWIFGGWTVAMSFLLVSFILIPGQSRGNVSGARFQWLYQPRSFELLVSLLLIMTECISRTPFILLLSPLSSHVKSCQVMSRQVKSCQVMLSHGSS